MANILVTAGKLYATVTAYDLQTMDVLTYVKFYAGGSQVASGNVGIGYSSTSVLTTSYIPAGPTSISAIRYRSSDNVSIGSISGVSVTILKGDQTAPSTPTFSSINQTSITLNTVSGCEYSINGGSSYQASTSFTGLSVGGSYSFVQRKVETSDYNPSPASASASMNTSKYTRSAPSAPALSSRTKTSITLVSLGSDARYRKDGGTWQSSTTFTGLSYGTSYSFDAYYIETSTYYATGDGANTVIKTLNPALPVKIGGVWKEGDTTYFKVSGVWKEAETIYIKIGGVWKESEQ